MEQVSSCSENSSGAAASAMPASRGYHGNSSTAGECTSYHTSFQQVCLGRGRSLLTC